MITKRKEERKNVKSDFMVLSVHICNSRYNCEVFRRYSSSNIYNLVINNKIRTKIEGVLYILFSFYAKYTSHYMKKLIKGGFYMNIGELYRKRMRCTITGVMFLMVGFIGLAIERFAQAKDFDRQIKTLALKNESKIDYVILKCSCEKETENK